MALNRIEKPKVGKRQQFKLTRPVIAYDFMKVTVVSQDGTFKGELPATKNLMVMFGPDYVMYLDAQPDSVHGLQIFGRLDNQAW